MKRDLTQEERDLTMHALKNRQTQQQILKPKLDYYNLLLDGGLFEANVLEQKENYKTQRQKLQGDLDIVERDIKILNQHLTEGVEVKEEKQNE